MANAREIWDTLSKIDVSDHVEHKGGLSYLSWAWAWGTLMEYYPEAEYPAATRRSHLPRQELCSPLPRHHR